MAIATINDWARRRREIRDIFPDDLLEDLKDSEPQLYNEAYDCDCQLAQHSMARLKLSVSPVALLPSILTKGWDRPKRNKYSKNWADMENLLKLYALGLFFKGREMTLQARHDEEELKNAAHQASISPKCKRGMTAEKRFEKAKTYLRFGMRTLDIFFCPDPGKRAFDLDGLDQEIYEETNEDHADKLRVSRDIALRVGRLICERYRTN